MTSVSIDHPLGSAPGPSLDTPALVALGGPDA